MSAAERRVLWIDAVAGASGDMCLGALVDLGVPVPVIRRAVSALGVGGWRIAVRRVRRGALAAAKVDVVLAGRGRDRYRPGHGHAGGGHGPASTWRGVSRLIRGSDLDPAVGTRALAVFRRLFEAEGKAHGEPPERVHLHEAGSLDAVIDIVGTCAAIAHVAPARIVVSPLTTGSGTVACAHGLYPVPGPATAELIRGVPLSGIPADGERLTPTGAALLTTLADAWGPLPAMRPDAVGYGAGDRDFPDRPNALRMIVGTAEPEAQGIEGALGRALVVEFTVDDATPQLLAFTAERLLERGALDVYVAPVVMKKGRPGHHVTVLARPEDRDVLAAAILRETTTLGLRWRVEGRVELERTVRRVRTPYGSVRVKSGRLDGVELHAWPEYEDCAAAARARGVPLLEVQHAALEAHRRRREET